MAFDRPSEFLPQVVLSWLVPVLGVSFPAPGRVSFPAPVVIVSFPAPVVSAFVPAPVVSAIFRFQRCRRRRRRRRWRQKDACRVLAILHGIHDNIHAACCCCAAATIVVVGSGVRKGRHFGGAVVVADANFGAVFRHVRHTTPVPGRAIDQTGP